MKFDSNPGNQPTRKREEKESEKGQREGGRVLRPESTVTSAVNELGPAYHRIARDAPETGQSPELKKIRRERGVNRP